MARYGALSGIVTAFGLIGRLAAQSFDVISVTISPPNAPPGFVRWYPGGRFVADNAPLDFVLQQIYGLRDFQIVTPPVLKEVVTALAGV